MPAALATALRLRAVGDRTGSLTKPIDIVVLGATGHFGQRIARRIVGHPNTRLTVTSRDIAKARQLAGELGSRVPGISVRAAALDQSSTGFPADLAKLRPDILIHTAGPYQGQDYQVAEACIACRSHYVDLADGREFVTGFERLNDAARKQDVLLVTGASTLPGVSSVVVDTLGDGFARLERIEISIAPAHQTPRGEGTVAAVLSYCGKPFRVLLDGVWTTRYGWQDLRLFRYPKLGWRLGAACDVPDLSLLPQNYDEAATVTFHAALEAKWEQWALWLMAWAVRLRFINNWSRFATHFRRMSEHLTAFGSDRGGMHVEATGLDQSGTRRKVVWHLIAEQNHGPEIPCTPALIVARRLANGQLRTRGALPCLSLFTLGDFDDELADYDVQWEIAEIDT